MAIVHIPSLMQDLTGGIESAAVAGGTVRQIVEQLEALFPGIRRRLCDGDRILPHIAVWIDGEPVRGMIQPVGENSEVHFLPAIAGG